MLLTTLKEKVAARGNDGVSPTLPGVLHHQEFNRLIERERCRSDRNAHPFSLVVFDSEGMRYPAIRRTARILRSRVRLTDDVGWFDGANLSVLLPDTTGEGAWSFVKKVRNHFEDKDSEFPARVYT